MYGQQRYGSSMSSESDLHRGKGPKGYRRSDDRIREDISDRFSDDGRLDASDIEISVSNSEVTLSGTVPTRECKRHAEDLAERISGVNNVENRLRVQSERSQSGTSGSSLSDLSTTGSRQNASASTTGSSSLSGGLASNTDSDTTSSTGKSGSTTSSTKK
jgi:hypothetical protein